MSSTIFAPATAPGRSGVAVIRVSGPDAGRAALAMTGRPLPQARVASLRQFRDPANGDVLDHGMLVWFPGPRSFTGEDVAEFHIHGGRAVLGGMLDVLGQQMGLGFAEAGGFARQAFRNGKLDLTEVEALADIVNADTAAQRRQAQRQLSGELGRLYRAWRERLIHTLAYLEAQLDFPEDDLPPDLIRTVRSDIGKLRGELEKHLAGANRGERLRDGLRIAVIGLPNAGKSSLVNMLSRRDVAIVAPEPGTTRDAIEVGLDLGGFPVTIIDTAGLRSPGGAVEAEGIRRALANAEDADLRLAVVDGVDVGNDGPGMDGPGNDGLAPELIRILREGDILAVNKVDRLADGGISRVAGLKRDFGGKILPVSALKAQGLDGLCDALAQRAAELASSGNGPMAPTRERHRVALVACGGALARAEVATAIELMAEDLRLASRELGRIVGIVDVEDILDVVFRELCIGK